MPEIAELKLISSATIRHKEKSLSHVIMAGSTEGKTWKTQDDQSFSRYEYICDLTHLVGTIVLHKFWSCKLGDGWKQCTLQSCLEDLLDSMHVCIKNDARSTQTKILCSLLFHAVA